MNLIQLYTMDVEHISEKTGRYDVNVALVIKTTERIVAENLKYGRV